MRPYRLSVLLSFFCLLLVAGKKISPGLAENDKVEVQATIMPNEDVNRTFGYDFQDHFTVLEVRVRPKAGPMEIRLDDFVLRTDKDGEKSTPFAASQIAGSGALVVNRTPEGGSASSQPQRGWRLPGNIGRSKPAPAEKTESAPAEQKNSRELDEKAEKELKQQLAAKVLPEKTTADPVTGLLFFSLEKQKVKDLELVYGSGAGGDKLRMRFLK